MKKAVFYVHGRGGDPGEAEHYRALFPGCDVFGADYRSETPWEAVPELRKVYDELAERYGGITVVANSIGAYFAVLALRDRAPEQAFLISPVADMEGLIRGIMAENGTTEAELAEKKTVPTARGEILSWDYLCYARENPPVWDVPTHILWGERDDLTDRAAVTRFAERIGATLTVLKDGEHWFHTDEQLAFLDAWVRAYR